MATKKKAGKKKAGKTVTAAALRWDPRWLKDPPPPFFKNLDRVAQAQLNRAKADFTAKVKEILRNG